jgi:DNA polymerase III subunit delta
VSKTRSRRRLSAAELVREVESEQLVPFYVLYGEEEYERERAASWLIERLAPQVGRDFNVDVFDADEAQPRDILTAYESYPMMAPRRLVVLRRCDRLAAEACRELEAIVDSPMESSILVAVGGKVDQRRRLFQQMGQRGCAVEFRTPYENKLPQWIQRQTRRAGATIDPEAADMLGLLVGRNLRELAGEIEKALTFVGEEAHITRDVVSRLAGMGRQASVFDMADAVGRGDRPVALSLTRKLVGHGEEPTRIVAMLTRHFQLLLRARTAMAGGISGNQALAAELGVSPFFVSSYLEQARGRSPGQLWAAMGALLTADSRLKSLGRRQAPLAMDLLIEQLCPPGGTPGEG